MNRYYDRYSSNDHEQNIPKSKKSHILSILEIFIDFNQYLDKINIYAEYFTNPQTQISRGDSSAPSQSEN